jgi:regulatory protein
MPDTAYLAAVKMLARRELSEAQLRQRLVRKAYEHREIDDAITRLKVDRTLDDTRVASAIARMETGIRKRGPLRVRQKLAAAGISRAAADAALAAVLEGVDVDALLDAALARRLKGRDTIADDAEMSRLYRQLTTQGFDSGQVMRLLRARRRGDA